MRYSDQAQDLRSNFFLCVYLFLFYIAVDMRSSLFNFAWKGLTNDTLTCAWQINLIIWQVNHDSDWKGELFLRTDRVFVNINELCWLKKEQKTDEVK